MRRILSLILALTLVFALVACSNEKNTSSDIDTSTHNTTQSDTESTDDTSTESNESNTTDENSSNTETSKPTSSKPTTNSNTNTQTSKPTESSKPTQSTTVNNNNNNNNSNNNNNNSNNSSTTPPESKPEEIEYCNESLIIERNFTPETFLASVMTFYNNNEFESFSPSPYTDHSAAFSENDLANGFAYFDILGYELASKSFPLCDFSVSRDGNQNFIKFNSFSINKSCTFKTESDVVRALKRDIDKFTRFLGDLGCSYSYRDKTTIKSVSSFTDDMILSIAKGDNSDLKIVITANNTFNFGNNEERFSLTLNCTKTDYGYLYSIRY